MDILRKYWPTPFKIEKGNLVSLLVQLVIFLVIMAVVGVLIGVLSAIPVLGIIFWIVGPLAEIYSTVGVVLCILKFIGVV